MGSNVYERAYRHTHTCWDNFISYRIKYTNMHIVTLIHVGQFYKRIESNVYEHAYRHTNTCWDNFISYRIKCI